MRENQDEGADWLLPLAAGDTPEMRRPAVAEQIAAQGFAALLAAAAPESGLPPATAEERAEAGGHADPDGFLHRRRLARALLAPLLGRPAAAIRILRDQAGAPRIAAPAGGLFISFSARAGINALALARRPVGIDIELLRPATAIPWNMLRADEQTALLALPEPARSAAFLRLWTAKEAVAKALGTGLALAPEAIRIADAGAALRRDAAGNWERLPIRRHNAHSLCRVAPLTIAVALLSSPASSFMRGGKSQERA
ncbi:MAG: 4'-phosphopantetheinyl transferase family protein [Rhabdaerophilum calidifontis]